MNKFGMPTEPRPLSSLESDEESFVVLGKSLSPDDDAASESSIEMREPINSEVVEEAKRLISKAMNSMSSSTYSNYTDRATCGGREEEEEEKKEEEQGTELPKMPFVSKGFDTMNTISIMTLSNDLTSEETQNKITQIIEENVRLKDTILQNNMSMKSQYERIIVWQEEVQKVHQMHKDKILEAKDIIEKLKKENALLTQEVEKSKTILTMHSDELSLLKSIIKEMEQKSERILKESSEMNMQEFELDVANKKIKELERLVQQLQLDKTKLPETIPDMTEIEKQLRELHFENASMKKSERKMAELEQDIEDYQKHILELEQEVDGLNMELKDMEKCKLDLAASMEKIQALQQKIEELEVHIASSNERHHNTSLLQEELTKARTQLASIQIVLTQVQQSRAAAVTSNESLKKDCDVLGKEVERLRKEAAKWQTNASEDECYALRTQLEVYKNDFEAEAAAKSALREEKEKLLVDIQNLQRRNHQLQEEVELMREHQDFHVYSPPNRVTGARANVASAPPSDNLKCPKCNFGFRTVNALENHVYRCIDLDEHLP